MVLFRTGGASSRPASPPPSPSLPDAAPHTCHLASLSLRLVSALALELGSGATHGQYLQGPAGGLLQARLHEGVKTALELMNLAAKTVHAEFQRCKHAVGQSVSGMAGHP